MDPFDLDSGRKAVPIMNLPKITQPRARRTLLLTVMALFSIGSASVTGEEFLTRSVYVPVNFVLCEHLHDAVLFQGDTAVALLPSKRIFQFTYYPKLGRVAPERVDVRVEGVREDGDDFVGLLAVTPGGIYTAHSKIELDLDKQLRRLRRRIDVRYDSVELKLRCSDTCERTSTPLAAAAEISEPEKR